MSILKTLSGALALAMLSYCGVACARFIQADPIGLEGGINQYSYVNGNPIGLFDPYGLLGTSLYANMRGVTLNEAIAVGRMGNVATSAGVAPAGIVATGMLVGPAAAVIVCEIPGAVATAATAPSAISIWMRIGSMFRPLPPNSALPPPVPPTPPAIVRQIPQAPPNPVPPNFTPVPAVGGIGLGAGSNMCPSPNVNYLICR
jgi:hypothetical protein